MTTTPVETERRKLSVTVLIETTGSKGQLDRTTRWVVNALKGAPRNAVGSCVAVSVRDAESGEFMGVSTTGEASEQMSEEITKLMTRESEYE